MDGVTASKAAKKPQLPDGYADVPEFLLEARTRFQEAVDADRENRDMGLDDQRFIANDQWDKGVKEARLKKGRPCLTINTLPQYVGQVVGDMLMNRPSIKVRPSEDGDKEVADVRQGLVRFIENRSNAEQVYVGAGESQVGCGIGHFRAGTAYSNDDTFDQDIKIDLISNPFAVAWDPFSVEPTGGDARYCFVVDEMPRKAFEAEYPDAQSSELMIPLHGDWATKDTVRVTEYWLMKEVKRTLALIQRDPNAEPTIEDVTEADDDTLALIVLDPTGKPRAREKMVRRACMYLITGQDILAGPTELPIKRVPIFRVIGRTQQVGDRVYRYSLVRNAKDSIRLKNLSRSSAAEYLGMSPRAQWLIHDSNKDLIPRFRQAHKSGDPVLEWAGQNKPERVDPPMAPNALFQESQFYDQDVKDTTGLHNASLGMQSNETSGKAILARERQGDTATAMYQFNLKAAIRECGRVINDLLPTVYDTARTIVTLGEDGSAKNVRVNDPNHPESIDLRAGKYDVEIETGPSYSTRRVEAAESMMAFIQAVPGAAAVAGDLIASAQDWPDADKIAARLKKALPPQFQDDDDADKTPEQQQAKAQAQQAAEQQQAMQQQAQQTALATQQAELAQAQANARKAEADAVKAEVDVEIAQIKSRSDAAELARDPLKTFHQAADLDAKLNPQPPAETTAAA